MYNLISHISSQPTDIYVLFIYSVPATFPPRRVFRIHRVEQPYPCQSHQACITERVLPSHLRRCVLVLHVALFYTSDPSSVPCLFHYCSLQFTLPLSIVHVCVFLLKHHVIIFLFIYITIIISPPLMSTPLQLLSHFCSFAEYVFPFSTLSPCVMLESSSIPRHLLLHLHR